MISTQPQYKFRDFFKNYQYNTQKIKPYAELYTWWGKKTVFIKPFTFLFTLKYNILKQIINSKILKLSELNLKNLTPHINFDNLEKEVIRRHFILNKWKIKHFVFILKKDEISLSLTHKDINIKYPIITYPNIGTNLLIINICYLEVNKLIEN